MSASSPSHGVVPVPWSVVKPYLSLIVLECLDEDPSISFGVLRRQLEKPGRRVPGKHSEVVARSELTREAGDSVDGAGSLEFLEIDQLFGLVRRKSSPPGWASDSAELIEVTYDLVLAVRRERLVAVRADGNAADRLQKWLNQPGQKQLCRISSKVLEATFMVGAAKGLWLTQVQRPSRLRPTSKATVGVDLGEGLDPLEDSNYAMGSARCEMPEDPEIVFLKGAVGVTVRHSQLWFKDSPDCRTYFLTVSEVLQLVSAMRKTEVVGTDQFRYLAQEVKDLGRVSGAFEISPVDPDSFPTGSAGGEERREAATLLQDAVLKVKAGSRKDRFLLDVGLAGTIGGTLAVNLRPISDGFTLDIGFDRGSGDPLQPARAVRDALEQGDLVDIYYESGHKYSGGKLWRQNFAPMPFPGWDWANFDGIDIEREKPADQTAPQDIHDAIGRGDDNSLFAWVAQTYNGGWLICDDGSGEAADFVHLSNEDVLSVIHVKGASSSLSTRTVSVSNYEVVASQASKNLLYVDRERLMARLEKTTLQRPASWTQGERADSRAEFLEMLGASKASGATEIVIVQPHLTEPVYQRLAREENGSIEKLDQLRLRLLEKLLHVTRASCVRYGLELRVISSKS